MSAIGGTPTPDFSHPPTSKHKTTNLEFQTAFSADGSKIELRPLNRKDLRADGTRKVYSKTILVLDKEKREIVGKVNLTVLDTLGVGKKGVEILFDEEEKKHISSRSINACIQDLAVAFVSDNQKEIQSILNDLHNLLKYTKDEALLKLTLEKISQFAKTHIVPLTKKEEHDAIDIYQYRLTSFTILALKPPNKNDLISFREDILKRHIKIGDHSLTTKLFEIAETLAEKELAALGIIPPPWKVEASSPASLKTLFNDLVDKLQAMGINKKKFEDSEKLTYSTNHEKDGFTETRRGEHILFPTDKARNTEKFRSLLKHTLIELELIRPDEIVTTKGGQLLDFLREQGLEDLDGLEPVNWERILIRYFN